MLVENLPAFRQEALAHRGDGNEAVIGLEFVENGELGRYPQIGRVGALRFPVAHAGHPDGTSQQPFLMPAATRDPRRGLPLRQSVRGHRSPTQTLTYTYAITT